MLFYSIEYLIFILVVFATHLIVKENYRWIILLLASYFFYVQWEAEYIVLILFSTFITFFGSNRIYNSINKRKRFWLFMVLSSNLGLLFIFKYLDFFIGTAKSFIQDSNISSFYFTSNIILPIGISFYTFQALSYCIDVYKGRYTPENNFGKFALYISFFPKLVLGPIERASNLLPQINKFSETSITQILNGSKRILWGFFKKIVIADKLAIIVDAVYDTPTGHNGLSLMLATYLFAFQIYCDFSGYCDIAIGTGNLFGYKLTENFKKPYMATSIADFWRRWHITLTSWFKDYLYIILGGNRVSKLKWCRNIVIVFLLSGLWHGASWNFVAWGIFHCILYIVGVITKNTREYINNKIKLNKYGSFHTAIKVIVLFNLVSLGWIFFRADSLGNAIYIIKTIFADLSSFLNLVLTYSYNLGPIINIRGVTQLELILSLTLLIFFIAAETLNWIEKYFYRDNPNNVTANELLLFNIIVISLIFLGDIGGKDFLYFKF